MDTDTWENIRMELRKGEAPISGRMVLLIEDSLPRENLSAKADKN